MSAKWQGPIMGFNASFGLEQNGRRFESCLLRIEQMIAYFYILSITVPFGNIK